MKFVVSTKSGKAYSASSEAPLFVGKRIGATVALDELGLTGFEAKITGGSDMEGFPMNKSVQGSVRKKIFAFEGVGVKSRGEGSRSRVSVRGNTISNAIAQVNLAVTKDGTVKIANVLGKGEQAEEDAMSAKERAIKQSLEMAGSKEIGEAPTKKNRH